MVHLHRVMMKLPLFRAYSRVGFQLHKRSLAPAALKRELKDVITELLKYDCYFVVNNKRWQLFLIKDNGVRKVTFFKLSFFFQYCTLLIFDFLFSFSNNIAYKTTFQTNTQGQTLSFEHCLRVLNHILTRIVFTDETNVPESLTNGIKVFSKIQFKECEQNSDLNKVESAY